MASESREQVKVVIIDTQYVVTDPLSFKSVVQSLTGKDSCVEEASFAGEKRKREPDTNCIFESQDDAVADGACGGGGGAAAEWKLAKGFSFKDLDRMIMEVPPVEEWYQLLAHYNILV